MRRTSAQLFGLIVGWTLVLVGIAGFFVEASFEDGEPVQGGSLLGFEVNGWHNVVHIASGLLLLWGSTRHRKARLTALVFSVAYLAVTIWGFSSDEVADVVPINTADNWLHLALAVLAFLVAFRSRPPAADRVNQALHPSSHGTSRRPAR